MTDFHDVRFPLHLGFGSRGGPMRAVDVLQMANGREIRNARGRHSRRQYNVVAGLRSREQAIELLNFYESRLGVLHGFRFRDPLDYDAAETIGIGDGRRTEFPLFKTYGSDPYAYIRRITKPVFGTVRVFVDGVDVAASTDHDTGLIQFQTAPFVGATLTASFEFDVPVRFASETLDIVLDDFGSSQIQDIPLIEILGSEEAPHG